MITNQDEGNWCCQMVRCLKDSSYKIVSMDRLSLLPSMVIRSVDIGREMCWYRGNMIGSDVLDRGK